MKVRVIEIAFNHPRALKTGARRVLVGGYEMSSELFAALNENVGGTLTIDEATREVQMMAIRFVTFGDALTIVIDVAGPEMLAKIHEWVKGEYGYREVTPKPEPKEYEDWARNHKVWL